MKRLGAALICLSAGLLAFAEGRAALDHWIDTTELPGLMAETSVEVLDRDGDLLRAYTVADGRWRLEAAVEDVDPDYIAMLIAYEDRRFMRHHGVDWIAAARAAGQAVTSGEIVSGGSTITMQVARLLEDSGTGSWQGKLRQVRVALALERVLDKQQILTLYLNRAPFGGNLEGVRAASLAYFGKPPRRLTTAEAALLVALPQSPEVRRPDRHPQNAEAARERVLRRMLGQNVVDADTIASAKTEPIPSERQDFPALAPHLADRVTDGTAQRYWLTIDGDMQGRLERLASETVRNRSDRVQVAIMVADHTTGEVLASVGSAGYEANQSAGFVDLTQSIRSPGSTLKPLIYGLAFDQGMVHPETLIADRPVDFDGYAPQNFDGMYRGELRVRTALQLSLNIPVVSLLDSMGPQHLVWGLRRAGVQPDIPGGKPGLAIALGGLGVSLEDLMRVYASIAHGGTQVDLRHFASPTEGFAPRRIMGEVAAWELADIMREVPRPAGYLSEGIAYKTGTSYGHRDAWAIGFDGRHVVGVWMGRADGTPVPGAFGGELAAPVMFEAFERVKARIDPIPAPPEATLIVGTSDLPRPLQRFRPRGEVVGETGPEFAFPPSGAIVEGRSVFARVSEGAPPFTWLANGDVVLTSREREMQFDLGLGFQTLTVIDSAGQSARTQIELR